MESPDRTARKYVETMNAYGEVDPCLFHRCMVYILGRREEREFEFMGGDSIAVRRNQSGMWGISFSRNMGTYGMGDFVPEESVSEWDLALQLDALRAGWLADHPGQIRKGNRKAGVDTNSFCLTVCEEFPEIWDSYGPNRMYKTHSVRT